MILLFPTNDGLSVLSEFEKANAFRYLAVVNGHISLDEIRKIEPGNLDAFLSVIEKNNTGPCNTATILTAGISKEVERIVQNHNIEVILTKETNITNAVMDYIKHFAISESDYCCCP
jgi:hypothetical protein